MMKIIKRFQALQGALLLHELSYLLLIVITAGVGIAWAFSWQQSSVESLRLSAMNTHMQNIRGELYRQLKEVFDASFLQDKKARQQYDDYTRRINNYYNELKTTADDNAEKRAVSKIGHAYQLFHDETYKLLTPGKLNSKQKTLLDKELEQSTFTQLESAFRNLEQLLDFKQQQLEQDQQRWMTSIIWLTPVPVLLALSLLMFSRGFVRRKVVKPLAKVIAGAKQISKGDLEHSIELTGAEEMKKLAAAINTMAAELAANRDTLIETKKQAALGELVPLVAHNIRNPLAGIRAASQVTLDEQLSPATRDALTDIIVAVDRLERWVTSLLSYLHPLTPHFSDSSLQKVADNAMSLIELQLADKQLALKREGWVSAARTVALDINLMEQTICNLVQNAIEASPKNGQIMLSYWQTDKHLNLSIDDQGRGLSYDPVDEPGRSDDAKRLSCGLGIPFALKVVRLHHGELSYHSLPQGGTRVTISIPAI